LNVNECGNISILSFLIISNIVTWSKKCFGRKICVLLFSTTAFVSNIFRSGIYFASFSRDGHRKACKSAGNVQVKIVRIKMDVQFVVKSEENPIRGSRVVTYVQRGS
jgi:hypothetical protein